MAFQCRICLDEEENIRLISPCKCKGSVQYIHVHCFLKEIRTTYLSRCSICLTKYCTKYRIMHHLVNKFYVDTREYRPVPKSTFDIVLSKAILIFFLSLLLLSYVVSMRETGPHSFYQSIVCVGVVFLYMRCVADIITHRPT